LESLSASSPLLAAAGPLAVLRAATRKHHDRIDRLMDLRRMHDRGHYTRVLQVFDAFLAGWEPAVAAALPARFQGWLRLRSRRPLLQRDLQVLGITAVPAAVLPAFDSDAAAWGSLYVLEGSALGGAVITRVLASAGLHAGTGAAYFHGWGDAVGTMWREARELLVTELAAPAAVQQACDAACLTFDTLSHLLENAWHERTAAA
jgi:heme oxygenase